jgi:hypothetical protein
MSKIVHMFTACIILHYLLLSEPNILEEWYKACQEDTLEQSPSCKKHAGNNEVHAPPPRYKFYISVDEDQVHASMFSIK